MEQKGSITVLLSSVFLCIILVLMTLIEGLMINVGNVQVQRAVDSASYALLSEYYIPLVEEYGLFAVEKEVANGDKVSDYLLASLEPYELIDQEDGWDLYNYNILDKGVSYPATLFDQETLENQIVEHMKYRVPLSIIEPFLQKLQAVSKISGTGDLVKAKAEKVDKPLSELSHSYEELIEYIEGFKSKKSVKEYFVKQIIVPGAYYSTAIPDASIKKQLENNIYQHNNTIEFIDSLPVIFNKITEIKGWEVQIKADKEEIKKVADSINKKQKYIEDKEKKIDKLIKEKDSLSDSNNEKKETKKGKNTEDIDNSIKELEAEIKDLKDAIDTDQVTKKKLQDSIRDKEDKIDQIERYLNRQYGKSSTDNYEEFLAYIEEKRKETYELYSKILGLTNKSIKVIEDIKVKSSNIREGIDSINADIAKNKDKYDTKTVESLKDDMVEIRKKIYDASKDIDLTDKTSLTRMNNLLTKNKVCLEHFTKVLKGEGSNRTFLIYGLDDYIIDHASNVSTDNNSDLFDYFNRLIEDCKEITDYYSGDLQFEFGNMNKAEDPSNHMNQQLDDAKEHSFVQAKKDDVIEADSDLFNDLPTIISRSMSSEYDGFNITIGEDGDFSGKFFDSLSNIDIDLEGALDELLRKIYVNEYIIEVFDDVTEEASGDREYFNYEVEYVIGGALNDFENTKIVERDIFLIRSAMNFLHILTSTEKKNEARLLAAAIAGWWTAGIGTIIIQGIIMGIWALAESFVDVYYLVQGDEVAFYKLDSDWVLGIDNIVSFGINQVADVAIKETTETIDKLSKEVYNVVADRIDEVSHVTTTNVDQFITDSTDKIVAGVKENIDQVDSEADRIMQETIEAVLSDKPLPEYPYMDEILVTTIQRSVLEQKDTLDKDGYSAIDRVSNYVADKSKEAISDVNQELVKVGKESLKDLTNYLGEELKNQAADTIETSLDGLEEDLNKYLGDKTTKSNSATDSDTKFSSIKFSYEDYLRLLLLMQNDEEKLLRVEDLIQLDMMENYNTAFRIKNYSSEVEVRAIVKKDLLFNGFLNHYLADDMQIGDGVIYEASSSSSY